MRLSFKALTIALSLGANIALTAPAFAQDGREAAARELVEEAIAMSRTAEIYQDFRVTLRDAILPVMTEAVAGKIPGGISSDPTDVAIMTKATAMVTLSLKAADEVEPVFLANRDAMIGEFSQILAKHFQADELATMRNGLRLTAARKAVDVVYATSRTITGYTYEELRAGQEFSSWMQGLGTRFSQNPQPQTPTPERVAKAQTTFNELMRVAHIDEMVADAFRFAKDVVLKTMPMDQQEGLRVQIEQFEFQYNLQKQIMTSAGPAALASYLDDADLDKLQALLRSPAMVKMFNLLLAMEKSITNFTVQDIVAARAFIQELEQKVPVRTPEQMDQLEAEVKAFSDKWSEKLMAAVSPQTRDQLTQNLIELEALITPKLQGQTR